MTEQATTEKKRSVTLCPTCQESMKRIGRTFSMRFLTGSKCYYCRECRQKFLLFLGHHFLC